MESQFKRKYRIVLSITLILLIIVVILSIVLITILLNRPPRNLPDSIPTQNLGSETTSPSPVQVATNSAVHSQVLPSSTMTPTKKIGFTPPEITGTQFASATQMPTALPQINVELIIEDELKGDYLTVKGGDQNYNYRLGPLAKGTYAVGPNNKFIVYLTDYGMIYAAKIGNPNFIKIDNVKRQYSATSKNVKPKFDLSFFQTDYAYYLVIVEGIFSQRDSFILPREITH